MPCVQDHNSPSNTHKNHFRSLPWPNIQVLEPASGNRWWKLRFYFYHSNSFKPQLWGTKYPSEIPILSPHWVWFHSSHLVMATFFYSQSPNWTFGWCWTPLPIFLPPHPCCNCPHQMPPFPGNAHAAPGSGGPLGRPALIFHCLLPWLTSHQGQEGRGSTRPVFPISSEGQEPGAFPQGWAWPSTAKCLHSKAGACHHPSNPFEAGQKACQQAPSLRAPLLALGGAVSCLRFAASHEREWQAQ